MAAEQERRVTVTSRVQDALGHTGTNYGNTRRANPHFSSQSVSTSTTTTTTTATHISTGTSIAYIDLDAIYLAAPIESRQRVSCRLATAL